MPTLGKVLWTVLFLGGAIMAVLGLGVDLLKISAVTGIDVFLFGVGSLSMFMGVYVWKTDLFN